jgi:TRAP-type uncharacterized transport system substrate-binding protein
VDSGAGGRLSRRGALRLILIGAISLGAGGHAPYGQWGVYRKRYLLILTTRSDPTSYELGTQIATILAERLPDSRAQTSRAPHKERIASLISSKQMDVALMLRDDAAALRAGAPPFSFGPVSLHTIVGLGDYLLVCRDDFPARHAWLICEAISKDRHVIRVPLSPLAPAAASPDARVPLHPGAAAYFMGRPLPDQEPQTGYDRDQEHEYGSVTRP